MSVAYPQIDLITILIAAVAQFALGWLWYMPGSPTGRIWMAGVGMTQPPAPSPKMGLWFVHAVVAAWLVAMVYAWAKGAGPVDGISVGLMVGLPGAVGAIVEGMTMSPRSGAFLAVQAGYALVGGALMGAVIGLLA